ncbi:MAG: hypothetical protein AUJ98_02055 [Bacteroidetes bacterium CG2_30_33_31]|nr:MAG: hypothetical protein AUJ98_02055 [Bacteroidetes bacterium CG2_30_33_31]
MDIKQFIKLIQKNIYILLGVPILLAMLVWYFTRNEAKIYSSSTTIYTGIASGMSLVSQEPRNVDFFGVKIVFDNFINIVTSRETMEEVGIELFAQNLMSNGKNDELITASHYRDLVKRTPKAIKNLIVPNDLETTKLNMVKYKNLSDTNFIYKLLNLEDQHYSVKSISKIKAIRIDNSDLIKVEYSNDDPGITKQTLVILTKVFMAKYRDMNQGQSSSVVKYFEDQVVIAAQTLKEAEDRLLQFNQQNDIINYYEQSKYIAAQKEELGVKIQNIRMDLVSAEAAVNELESKLGQKALISLKSKNIIKLRNQLSDLTSKDTYLKTTNEDGKNDKKLVKVANDIRELKTDLQLEIKKLSSISETKEGLPIRQVLTSWLENIVKLEESKAQLSILNERKMEFEQTYKRFAPLGATMKRIEREINVAEQAYLSLLNSLGLAKLKQQNIEMSSSSEIVDAPFFPITAQPSKRKILVAAAGIIGFIFTLALIIILEYLDTTIKNPDRLKKLTELELAGIFPKLGNYSKRINFDFVKNRMVELITQSINYNLENVDHKTKIVTVFSTQNVEGKTVLTTNLANMLGSFGLKVLQLNYKSFTNKDFDETVDNPQHTYFEYVKNSNFPEVKTIDELLGNDIKSSDYDFIFVEFPSIIYYQYPVKLMSDSDLNLLVVRSNRNWTKADTNALNIVKSANKKLPIVVLNGVDLDTIDLVLGEIPKQRSRIRRIVKKLLTLQLRSKYTFK